MGSILRIDCAGCGYHEEMCVGCGFVAVCYEASTCAKCRRVVPAQVTRGAFDLDGNELTWNEQQALNLPQEIEPRCPDCRGEVEKWGTDDGERHTTGPCPRCADEVTVNDFGLWD